jgi:uncharacterized protein with PIN domain
MVTASFRFHGTLQDFIARERRGRDFEYQCARAATVKHAVEALGVPHTEIGPLTVNGHAATLSRIVRAGDHVEAHPVDVQEADLGSEPLFIADAHLGGLARLLRMLGFDTVYHNHITDRELIAIAASERRIILTRDRELLKCREVLRGMFVRALKPEAQLRETVRRWNLVHRQRPFSLCLHCNLRLEAIDRDTAAASVPEAIRKRYAAFARCPGCNRIYWPGSHWERMSLMLDSALSGNASAESGVK